MDVDPAGAPADARPAPRHGADNARLFRHLAALLVIVGHSRVLSMPSGSGATDVFDRWLPGFYASSIAVCLFFA